MSDEKVDVIPPATSVKVASADTAADTDPPVIELRHVEKHYGELHVLRDVNLKVSKGEVLVVIGPSEIGRAHV